MGSPTTIHPFPELRALAEEEARAYATTSDGTRHEAVELYARVRFTLMLCDLERPASRDAVSRLVAKRCSVPVGEVHRMIERVDGALCDVLPTAVVSRIYVTFTEPMTLALIVRHLWPEESP